MNQRAWLLVVTVLLLPFVMAQRDPYHLKLLAVQESEQGYSGSDADLYLELRPGYGRVFLETFPLTQMDTQISTRFAKEIACNYFRLDCQNYDFFYTIKAKTNIIGGPSAGAAIAALTTIAVLDLDYDQSIAVTGTINSGGIIGPVGGVKEKLEAAAKVNLKKVLIATGTAQQKLNEKVETNSSEALNLIDYARENLSLEALEVMDLNKIIQYLTTKNLHPENITVQQNGDYTIIMQHLQERLCNRTENIQQQIPEDKIAIPPQLKEEITASHGRVVNATVEQDYYSAASFCFGANIQLKSEYYQQKNITTLQLRGFFTTLNRKVKLLEEKIKQEKIDTISDLQTLMIVKERLNDVRNKIQEFNSTDITTPETQKLLAYAEERYFSAAAWSEFFQMDGQRFVLNRDNLRSSCMQKIAESEERLQYVSIFLQGNNLMPIHDKIEEAQSSLDREEFELCLITAAQAKADADAIISSLGISTEAIDEFIQAKQKAVERVISENSAEGMFPILGYSYYRYALSLQNQDKFSAMLYLEYALEMSDLGIYFPEEKNVFSREVVGITKNIPAELVYTVVGIVIGILATLLYQRQRK